MPADPKNKPDPGATASVAIDPTASLTAFWSQWMEQTARGTQALLGSVHPAAEPQQMQRQWLDAVSRSLDDFMRTPAFMEIMKQNLKAITDLKGMQDHVVKGAARQLGAPLAEDITGLYERLHSTEQTILNRLKAIEDRLKAIETHSKS